MKNEVKPRLYDVLAKAFAQERVRTCFALLGDANMNWASRLSEEGCRMVYVRHEHCALAAAMAYSRKNWDVGVATVTCGPGVTQLITALPAAVRPICRWWFLPGRRRSRAVGITRKSIRHRSSPQPGPRITAFTCPSACLLQYATRSCRRVANVAP